MGAGAGGERLPDPEPPLRRLPAKRSRGRGGARRCGHRRARARPCRPRARRPAAVVRPRRDVRGVVVEPALRPRPAGLVGDAQRRQPGAAAGQLAGGLVRPRSSTARTRWSCCCRSRWPTTPTSTPRSTTPRTWGACSAPTPNRCCPTGSTSPSATTAGPARVVVSGTPVRPTERAPARRGRAALRAEPPARHRARGGHRGGHRHGRRQCHRARRRRRARVRLRPAERLVGARHPGLRVPTARAVPGQELRHDDLAVGRHARRAGALPRRAARAGPAAGRPPARRPDRGASTSTSRSTCAGRR